MEKNEKDTNFIYFFFACCALILALLKGNHNQYLHFLSDTEIFEFLPIVHTLNPSETFDHLEAHSLLVLQITFFPILCAAQLKWIDFSQLYPKKIKNDFNKKIISLVFSVSIVAGLYYTDWSARLINKTLTASALGFLFISSAIIFCFSLYFLFILKILISFLRRNNEYL